MSTTEPTGAERAPTDPAPPPVPYRNAEASRVITGAEAIRTWRTAMIEAAAATQEADLIEAKAVLESTAGSDGKRKAEATVASAAARHREAVALAEARAAGALVELLIGRAHRHH